MVEDLSGITLDELWMRLKYQRKLRKTQRMAWCKNCGSWVSKQDGLCKSCGVNINKESGDGRGKNEEVLWKKEGVNAFFFKSLILFCVVIFLILLLSSWVLNAIENGLDSFMNGSMNFFLTNFHGTCVEIGGIVARLAFVLGGLEGAAAVMAIGIDNTGAIALSGIPMVIIFWVTFRGIAEVISKITDVKTGK